MQTREVGQAYTVVIWEMDHPAGSGTLTQPRLQPAVELPTVVKHRGMRAFGQPVSAVKQGLILDQPKNLITVPSIVGLNA